MKRSNPKRKAKEFRRVYHSSDRVEFVKLLPCICLGCENKPSENAHVGPTGMTGAGYKADAEWIVSLCQPHHTEYHQIGRESFALKYKLDLPYHARMTELTWSLANGDAP